jgi:hypothetical protein
LVDEGRLHKIAVEEKGYRKKDEWRREQLALRVLE